MVEAYQQGPDYVVEHPPWVMFRFSKLRESSRSGYYANLRVSLSDAPGYGSGSIFNSNVIFGGVRSKADVIKACSVCDLGEDFAWRVLVEQSIEAVQDMIEMGSPIRWLDEEPEPAPRPYLVDKLLRYEEPTLIYGLGGANKSYMALAIGACIAMGQSYMDLDTKRAKVLYLDYEDVEDTHKHRLEMLRSGWGLSTRPAVGYKEASLSLPSMADSLSRQIAAEGIEVLIIDSVAMACGGKPEEAETATAFFRALRALRLKGVLMLGHHTKAANDYPFGSVFWWNQSRSIWLQKKSQEAGERTTSVGLVHRKINNGTLFRPLGFEFQYSSTSTVITPTDASKIVDLRSELSYRAQILAVVTETQGLSRDKVFEVCNDLNPKLTRHVFRNTLGRMKGLLVEREGKLYLLDLHHAEST